MKTLLMRGKYLEAVKNAYADEFTVAIGGDIVHTHEGEVDIGDNVRIETLSVANLLEKSTICSVNVVCQDMFTLQV
jgi:hypothetical protein